MSLEELITNSEVRSGRQGDPGVSRFFIPWGQLNEDFASDKVSEIMKKLGMEEGEAIEHKWVQILLKTLKKKEVEAHNFDIRKTLLEYDDISNEQRKLIYQQRDYILKNSINCYFNINGLFKLYSGLYRCE